MDQRLLTFCDAKQAEKVAAKHMSMLLLPLGEVERDLSQVKQPVRLSTQRPVFTYMTAHGEKEESTIITIIDPSQSHTLRKEAQAH